MSNYKVSIVDPITLKLQEIVDLNNQLREKIAELYQNNEVDLKVEAIE